MNETGWWLILRPPETVRGLLVELRQIGLFSENESWWFAWNNLDIVLPGLLENPDRLDEEWETLRIFSPLAELRVARQGRQRGYWLLLETDPEAKLDSRYPAWVTGKSKPFRAEKGYHLLAGQKLRLPHDERRGEILYPRLLDYGLKQDDLNKALAVQVWNYYDDFYRLATVRYAQLKLVDPGSGEVALKRFPSPEEVFGLNPQTEG